MLQCVADDVFVEIRQYVVTRRAATHRRRVAALQYVVQNRSLRRVTVRLDFSLSRHIELVFPEEVRGQQHENRAPTSHGSAANMMLADVVVGPLQRRHVVHVTRADADRAFVRVEYAVVGAVDVEEANGSDDNTQVQRWITQSAATYASVGPPNHATGVADVSRWCADVNRWSRQRRVHFVDMSFPPTEASLWGSDGRLQKQTTTMLPVTWMHLSDIVDASWQFVASENKDAERTATTWSHGVVAQDSWLCAIDALHGDAVRWCAQWFGDADHQRWSKKLVGSSTQSVISVNLSCGDWRERATIVVDLFVPVVSAASGGGLACAWPYSGDLYAVLLQKAYAKVCGSYATVATIPTRSILQALMGRPIVQVFPGGAWDDASGGEIENLKTMLSATKRTRRMVSFGCFDGHHCAFQLVGESSLSSLSSSNASNGVKVRDPTGNLHRIASTKLGCQLDIDEEDGTCVIPEEAFIRLAPVVFELLTDHAYQWRRRQIAAQVSHYRDGTSLQVAISCASLQNITVRCYAKRLSGAVCHDAVKVTVDRVGDDESWTRLDLKPEHDDESADSPCTQVYWTVIAGEYVLSLTRMPSSASREVEASTASTCSAKDIQTNLSLLFRMLDRDVDGVVDRTELVDFLCSHEHLSSSDSPDPLAVVDSFLQKHAGASVHVHGITKDDLLQVYESVAAATTDLRSTTGQASMEDIVAELIWNDLHYLLTNNASVNDSSTSLALNDVYELCCVVSSDRDDVVLAMLS